MLSRDWCDHRCRHNHFRLDSFDGFSESEQKYGAAVARARASMMQTLMQLGQPFQSQGGGADNNCQPSAGSAPP